MAIQLQIRRGTTAENEVFTGAVGELTMDTDTNSIRVHDGSTVGGIQIPSAQTADYVVEWQVPTDLNNYTWYRLYKSGWIEQGGIVDVAANSQYNGTFIKPFNDTNVCFYATDNTSALSANQWGIQQGCGVSSTTNFYLRNANDGTTKYSWQAYGMAA